MKTTIAAALVLGLLSTTAHAGTFADEMGRCLVRSTDQADRNLLVRWVFVAMAKHPEVKEISTVSDEHAEKLNKGVADLFVKLLTVKCKKETQEALKYEGPATMRQSFEILGQVAMQGLMTSPEVAGFLSGLEKHLDIEALKKTFDAAETK